MSHTDTNRYHRQTLLADWDQERLRESRVLVAGAGAIGNEVLKLLALMGVGRIVVVDFDMVELSNLSRCVLFGEADIGKSKAIVAAERVHALNPEVTITPIHGNLEFEVGLGIYHSMDVVIGCLDSLAARIALNRICRLVRVPWVNGGIGTTYGEVSLYGAEGVCFACRMGEEDWADYNRRYQCSGLKTVAPQSPTPTTAIPASLVGAFLVNEAVNLLQATNSNAKIGLQYGQRLWIQTAPYELSVQTHLEAPGCYAHEVWEPIEAMNLDTETATIKSLLAQTGISDAHVELGFDLLCGLQCIACGHYERILQPLAAVEEALTYCPLCKSETRRPIAIGSIDVASEYAEIPLRALGIPPHPILTVWKGGECRYLLLDKPFE